MLPLISFTMLPERVGTVARLCLFEDYRGDLVANADPLLVLLKRYLAERKAFDDAPATHWMTDEDWDTIALTTWSRTQDQIIQSEPPATSAAGALLALDHVLQSDDLFSERSECPDLQMLWLLVKAARDYIASVEMHYFSKAS
jgi:hypothetical protein